MYTFKKIHKCYDDLTVFENIEISIENKSIVALTGKNGIGKTTLLNIMGGIIKFDGDIDYCDISLKKDYSKYMKKVSLITNENFLYEYLNLIEIIELIFSLDKNINKNKSNIMIEELIEVLDINQYKNTITKNLSLGTRQKISIIINLINFPKIILFDEPFVNLDHKSVESLISFFGNYIEKNAGIIIFSTHSDDLRLSKFSTHTMKIIDNKNIVLITKKG
ncbi:MAG: ATP-binding cassette domain-containing protein [Eubacteriaceae bacterium]